MKKSEAIKIVRTVYPDAWVEKDHMWWDDDIFYILYATENREKIIDISKNEFDVWNINAETILYEILEKFES